MSINCSIFYFAIADHKIKIAKKLPRQTDKTDIVFLILFYYVALDFFAGLWDN
jgi:hypothetical protein